MSVSPAEILLSPYTLGDLNLKNRIVMAPLTRTRAENRGKVPNELMVEYYTQRAGAGLIITEGTFVSEQGQGWFGASDKASFITGASYVIDGGKTAR